MDAIHELLEIEARLTAPGAPFEIGEERVLGEPMRVFVRRARSLGELLERSRAFGDAEYLVFGATRLSYAAHLRQVASVATALRDRFGVRKGDRVAILAANRPEWIVTFWATVSLGAVAVGMNGWWAGPEIHRGIAHAEPALLVADRQRLDRVRGSAAGVPVVEMETEFAALLAHAPDAPLPRADVDEDDPAVILYTSGTTGFPKGAVSTHRNILALLMLQQFHGARIFGVARGGPTAAPPPPAQPVLLTANPLFHVSGLYAGAIAHLAAGARSVWNEGRFDAGATLALIERERVTGWSPHGPMARRLLEHPDRPRRDLSSVRTIGTGGAPVPAELLAALRDAFPAVRPALTVGYGLTEGTALATMNFGEELVAHPASSGRPLPTVDVEIRDAAGRALPDGEEGEITLRGPLVMRGYFRDEEATAAAIGPGRWLRTGDVGTMRAPDGGGERRLYVASRRRDLILRGAENVYPAEIEQRIAAHPSVEEVAVIGVPSRELGQEVKAIVVPRAGAAVDPDVLARWVGEALAYYKVPAHWEVRAEPLPRNASGKVVKVALEAPEGLGSDALAERAD
jgi:long-chain acyl-CoA synthetase